jgi:hypothetical protein
VAHGDKTALAIEPEGIGIVGGNLQKEASRAKDGRGAGGASEERRPCALAPMLGLNRQCEDLRFVGGRAGENEADRAIATFGNLREDARAGEQDGHVLGIPGRLKGGGVQSR